MHFWEMASAGWPVHAKIMLETATHWSGHFMRKDDHAVSMYLNLLLRALERTFAAVCDHASCELQ